MYSPEHAEQVIRFVETYCTHGEGRFAGQPFRLAQWQKDRIIRPLYGTLNDRGLRQYRTGYLSFARKNGKSVLMSALGLYHLCGDGEEGAQVIAAANDRQQASIVFKAAADMVRRSAELSSICRVIDSSKRILFRDRVFRAISADSDSQQGLNPSAVIADEIHVWRDRRLWDVLVSAVRSRLQPLVVAITTAGDDEFSLCHELYDYATQVSTGVIEDPSFHSYIAEVPADADWHDERNWKLANPGLGTLEEIERGEAFLDIEALRAEYRKATLMPSYAPAFRRYSLNQWVTAGQDDRFIELADWDACNEPLRELDGRPCYAGLDLSSTTDLTALSLVFPADDGSFDVLPFFWLPADNVRERMLRDKVPYSTWVEQGHLELTPGNCLDHAFVVERVRQLAEQYDIREIAFDRWGAQAVQHQLAGLGLTVFPFGQGYASMSGPTKELQRLILSRQIRHGDNPVLRWNFDNARVVNDPAGNIKITKPDARKNFKRIDGAVATVMGLSRASLHQTSSGDAFAWVTGLKG